MKHFVTEVRLQTGRYIGCYECYQMQTNYVFTIPVYTRIHL
mgnify:CR=1 FL=1